MTPLRLIALMLAVVVCIAILADKYAPVVDRIETMVSGEVRAKVIDCRVAGKVAHIVEKDGSTVVTCED